MVRCVLLGWPDPYGQASRGISAAFNHRSGSLMRLGLRPGRSGRRSAHHRIAQHRTRPIRGSAHRGHHPHHDHHGTQHPALATSIGHHPATRHAVPPRRGPGAVGLGCRHGRRRGRGCGQSRDRRRDHSHREQHSGQTFLHGTLPSFWRRQGGSSRSNGYRQSTATAEPSSPRKQYTDHMSPKIVSGRRSCDNSCQAGHPTHPGTYLLKRDPPGPARPGT